MNQTTGGFYMDTNKHRGPEKGYNSRAKQSYRKAVWESMHEAIKIANNSDGIPYYILMLPGLSTKEIDTAIRYGLRPDRIILVHESSTQVENNAEWRIKYPQIKYYTGILSSLQEEFKKDKIRFAGANLDFCGNFSSETINEFSSFCDYCSKNQYDHIPVTLGLTVSKGRETPSMVKMLEKLHSRNSPIGLKEKRLEILAREFGFEVKEEKLPYTNKTKKTEINVLVEGDYVHNKAPMGYCVVEYKHPNAFLSQLKERCSKEAASVLKELNKVKVDKKYTCSFNIKTEEDFLSFNTKREALLTACRKFFGKGSCSNLKEWYNMTEGHKTRVKTTIKTFLSRKEALAVQLKLYKYNIDISNGLDFFLSDQRVFKWCGDKQRVVFTDKHWSEK